jgi:hypothetical protein
MSVTVTSSKRLTQLRSADAIVSGSVTANSFVGALTGNASTATTAATVTTAAQPAITSVGTLTTLNVSSHITASGNISASGTGSFGMVGIGTATPNKPLHIYSTASDPLRIQNSSDANYNRILYQKPSRTWSVGQNNGNDFVIADETAAAFRLAINTSGNVGIGTTNPSSSLHISSGTSGDATLIIESDTDNSDENDNPKLQFRQDGGLVVASAGITGNAGSIFLNSLANTAYLGSEGDTPLQLFTNSSARLTILNSSGNVGIGTTSPTAKLHVAGNIWASGSSGHITASGNINAGGTGSFGMVGIGKTNPAYSLDCLGNFNINGSNQVNLKCNNQNVFNGFTTQTMINSVGLDKPIVFTLNQGITEAMRIAGTTGNVGIGTDSPGFKLQVKTPVLSSGSTYAWPFDLTRINNTSRGFSIGMGSNNDVVLGSHNSDMAFGHTYGTDANGQPSFFETMRIQHVDQAVGNVGIGTTSPTAKLHVVGDALITGKITAQEFHTEFVSASIIYQSGSTKFGDTSDDVHSFSGSLRVTGSGDHYFTDGNVGIGTASPNAKLQVDGLIAIRNNGGLSYQGEISTNGGEIRIGQSVFKLKNSIPILWSSTTDGNGTKDLGLRRNSAGVLEVYDGITATGLDANRRDLLARNITASANISASGTGSFGMVGIVTASPDYLLDIGGTNSNTSNTIRIGQNNGGTAIRIGSGGGSSDVVLLRIDGDSPAGGHDGETDSSNYGFSFKYFGTGTGDQNRFGILSDNQTAATQVEAITILQSGNVGIGETTPTAKLHVAGNISSSGTITANSFVGSLTGNASTATSATSATSATTAATVTEAAQPSITSVGTLTTLNVSGNITASNISASGYIYGKLRRIVESKTSDYTLVASDAGKVILMDAGGVDITIPASVFTAGDEFTIINNSGSPTACLVKTNPLVTMFVVGTAYLNANFTLAARRGVKFICEVGGASPRFYGWRS